MQNTNVLSFESLREGGRREYYLLFAWYFNRLKGPWQREKDAQLACDSRLSEQRAGEKAAAHVAVWLSIQYQRLEKAAREEARQVGPDDTGPHINFYDALQDEKVPSYRQVLQDLSGTRTLSLDEQGILAGESLD